MTSVEQFRSYLASPEGGSIEFKEARSNFHFEDLVKYCVALANAGGGKVVLGVTDKRPRSVVSTAAFSEPGRTEAGLFEQLHQRIPIEEHTHDGKLVLIVHVSPRLAGTAWQYRGSFWMRAGDALVPMTDDHLKRIHEETGPDFSAELCTRARLDDLDSTAIDVLRRLCMAHAARRDPGPGVPAFSRGDWSGTHGRIQHRRFSGGRYRPPRTACPRLPQIKG